MKTDQSIQTWHLNSDITSFAEIKCSIHKTVGNTTNLVIGNPVRHKRCKHQKNFANNFDFVNSTVMKATTMSNFGVVKEAWCRLWGTTEIQHIQTCTTWHHLACSVYYISLKISVTQPVCSQGKPVNKMERTWRGWQQEWRGKWWRQGSWRKVTDRWTKARQVVNNLVAQFLVYQNISVIYSVMGALNYLLIPLRNLTG